MVSTQNNYNVVKVQIIYALDCVTKCYTFLASKQYLLKAFFMENLSSDPVVPLNLEKTTEEEDHLIRSTKKIKTNKKTKIQKNQKKIYRLK